MRHADACLVNLPDPARYGLHKLIVAAERGAKNPRYGKDILQALVLALIEWHLERARHAIKDSWRELTRRGADWVKRAHQSLRAAPAERRELVASFERKIASK